MTWPTTDVVTTNADAGTDSPATFRSDVLDLLTKFNLMRNHVSSLGQTLLNRATAALMRSDLGAGAVGDTLITAVTQEDAKVALGSAIAAQNSQSAHYTLVLADAGKHILHPSADTTSRTFTIPANASVPYPIGTTLVFVNQNGAGTVIIAITTDTLRLAVAGSTGSRSLYANGLATALKITATEWIISGSGLI